MRVFGEYRSPPKTLTLGVCELSSLQVILVVIYQCATGPFAFSVVRFYAKKLDSIVHFLPGLS